MLKSYIIDSLRSPIVMKNSEMLGIRSDDLSASIVTALLDRNQIGYNIKKLWPNGNVIIGLSVRTIFDALLSELNFNKGSEVIMTGINIPDMVKILIILNIVANQPQRLK